MLVILKIPVVYLCAVVWWAIRAEPLPLEGAGRLAPLSPTPPECGWRAQRRARAPAWPRAARRRSRAQARTARVHAALGCACERRLRSGDVQTLVDGRHGRGLPRDDLHLRQLSGAGLAPDAASSRSRS